MVANPAYKAKETSWRVDSLGRLLQRYDTDIELRAVWAAAKRAGVPEGHRNSKGCPADELPESAWFSEFILRAFEAAFGQGGDYPRAGFTPDLREIAYNLDYAARVLDGMFGITPTASLIPVGWLKFRADLAGKREAVQKTVLTGGEYPYLSHLWAPADFGPYCYDLFDAPSGPDHDSHSHGKSPLGWVCHDETASLSS